MKLRLNLYTQAIQPEREKVSLKLVLQIVLSLVLVLTLLGLVLDYRAASLTEELAAMQQKTAAQQSQIEQLRTRLQAKTPSPLLVKQHSELSQMLAQKNKLLNFVQNEQKKTAVKYGPVFDYLAQIDPQGFWLTSFKLSAQRSTFKGYVLKADLLPYWLNQLGQNAFFKGQSFAQFELEQHQSQVLSFVVQSEKATAAETTAGDAP
ncbi:PilN domain-containing protein [Rheinheimera sp.]|uniref:PilN domain-containing protein n=1 Tax=Rheinheimera sp. TaxID=1869214 RepID=UPI00307DB74C